MRKIFIIALMLLYSIGIHAQYNTGIGDGYSKASVTNFAFPDEFIIPVLVSPANLATNVPFAPTLTWEPASNSTRYRIQVATNYDFITPIIDTIATSNSKSLNELASSTQFYWRVQTLYGNQASEWSEVWSFTTKSLSYALSGTLKYANSAATALNNCIVILKSDSTEIARDTTDSTGNYIIPGIPNGSYTIEVLTNKAHGGINGLDVALLRQKIGNTANFTTLQMLAGDINDNGSINSLDVAPLRLKIANTITPNWQAPNYVFSPLNTIINDANIILNIQALCSGDVNGSFIPLAD